MSSSISERGEQIAKLVTEAEQHENYAATLRQQAAELIAPAGAAAAIGPASDPEPSTATVATDPVEADAASADDDRQSSGGKPRYRRTVEFRHRSVHPKLWDAYAFANSVKAQASNRDNLEVIEDGEHDMIVALGDRKHELDLRFRYGPVIGGYPSDGERILDKAREAHPPISEQPLEMTVLESETL